MLPGNTDIAGPRNILWEPLAQSNSSQLQDLRQINHLRSWNNNPTKSGGYSQWFLFRRPRMGLGIKLEVNFPDLSRWYTPISGLYYFWWEVSEKKFLSLVPYRQCVLWLPWRFFSLLFSYLMILCLGMVFFVSIFLVICCASCICGFMFLMGLSFLILSSTACNLWLNTPGIFFISGINLYYIFKILVTSHIFQLFCKYNNCMLEKVVNHYWEFGLCYFRVSFVLAGG